MKRVLCVFELSNKDNKAKCNYLTNLQQETLLDINVIKELESTILEIYPDYTTSLLVNLIIMGDVK